ncbi:Helix-turn-helix protein [Idiomarina sp. A28L]|uniref:helix-turn-helix domain-containing protein n=1 Tax=Idiomarina sp. A28L TaxID=1036674 RepID=UPI0002138DC0|nr:helix-turn-helix domain-containing protein [Idiomarina sp. A28L]EGN75512.1 Helix-turn-helix protein [Idiomarina sp. A28L]
MATRIQIGNAIRANRKSLGYTQQALSGLTGIHKSTISEIENGRFTGSFDILERVLDAVGLQLEVSDKKHRLPDWDELDTLFTEDDA